MKDLFLLRFLAIVFSASAILYFILGYKEPNIYLAIVVILVSIFIVGAFIGLIFSLAFYFSRNRKRFFDLKIALRKGLIVGIIVGSIIWIAILIHLLISNLR